MHCPPGGPRKAYCLLCLTHAATRHLIGPIHKMRLELHRRAKANGLAVLGAPAVATPDPAPAP
eukprot:7796979-Lingulodinium_polyedra.AAC.1